MGKLKVDQNNNVAQDGSMVEYHIKEILRLIGEDVEREGLLETPARVRRMYEEVFRGYSVNPIEVLGVTFNEAHEELIVVKDIQYYSYCEHHMAPFYGKVHIGYIPNGMVAGLSKFARLVDAITSRLQLQERVTTEIADTIESALSPNGVYVIVEGTHHCMCARGIRKTGSVTVTTSRRGLFKVDGNLRTEFMETLKL